MTQWVYQIKVKDGIQFSFSNPKISGELCLLVWCSSLWTGGPGDTHAEKGGMKRDALTMVKIKWLRKGVSDAKIEKKKTRRPRQGPCTTRLPAGRADTKQFQKPAYIKARPMSPSCRFQRKQMKWCRHHRRCCLASRCRRMMRKEERSFCMWEDNLRAAEAKTARDLFAWFALPTEPRFRDPLDMKLN
ncbi:hypothetical protein BO78DRAFT_82084 [Aspergillus sclerotiicarbonarius CBS 121057]|uniref:Uncharacterized protein n=1 Tax=Aspergillus sclerotiicarbonarius (strain CBS 121057 / IBT 28362) TaxID=1448318 RepID=A0A319ECI5_ASPSB|nr:hypothetical protein BO78DRAFT_82084 [Aspergillus sclerotiicarbonarius CBS 121057]